MKYCFAALLPLLLLLSVFSCKPDDEIITKAGSAKLEFSTDTVFFDTVFVQTGSVTKRLKVYNRNDKAVEIRSIRLEKLGASAYDLIIDGQARDIANNITLRGKDSLLVLVKVLIDPTNDAAPFIVEDNIIFETNGNNQKITLGAYGQNANFFRDTVLTCNSVWQGPKAFVLYGGVVVPQNCTLTIMPGTRIYAHNGAVLYVQGTLKVEGIATDQVFFQNDRRDSVFANVPGQWEGIFLDSTSKNNKIAFTQIKNATFGLRIYRTQSVQTEIKNSVIKNMFVAGLLGVQSGAKVENSLITNCGQFAVIGQGGGNYDFNYSTIANYTPDFKRDDPAMAFSDSVVIRGRLQPPADIRFSMKNSIVYNGPRNGKMENEILFLTRAGLQNVTVQNSLVQTTRYQNDPKFTGNGNLLNQDPKFVQPGDNSVAARKINYSLKDDSPAIGGASSNGVNIDLQGKARPAGSNPNPDMGAYENTK